jgi:GNAT superfamily N-acetyltransferase
MALEFVTFDVSNSEHLRIQAALTNTLYDNHRYTAEQTMFERDGSEPDPGSRFELVYLDGQPVAYLECVPFAGHPHWLEILIDPSAQRRGIGTAILERIHAELAPNSMEAQVREDWTAHLNFYAKHGFTAGTPFPCRVNESPRADPDLLETVDARLEPIGVQIRPWSEHGDTPEHREALVAALNGLRAQVNLEGSGWVWTSDALSEELLDTYWFHPERLWLALERDAIVGAAWAAGYENDRTLFLQDGGGVIEAFKRKGIGSALIARVLQVAADDGYARIEAHPNADNPAEIALLERHGFGGFPGYLMMTWRAT